MRRRRAFSLVELLVVIGIIAVLVTILLPSVSRAREQGKQVACMSNVRQLGQAFAAYALENDGVFPFHADVSGIHPEDWIWWQPGRDVNQSAIAKYTNGFNRTLLTCPSDDPSNRPRVITTPYRYSYTFNYMFASNATGVTRSTLRSVHNASGKILLVDEDEASLDDGNFHPLLVGQVYENYLSIRHDRRVNRNGVGSDDDRRGNVAFADGHAEYVSRRNSRDPAFYDPRQ